MRLHSSPVEARKNENEISSVQFCKTGLEIINLNELIALILPGPGPKNEILRKAFNPFVAS